jgi:hypothetical protein
LPSHVWGLEVISKWPREDEDHREVKEREVVVGFAVASGADPSFCFQPGVGAFDGPAVAGLGVAGLDLPAFAAPDLACRRAFGDRVSGAARPTDPGLDSSVDQSGLELSAVVAAISPELIGPQLTLEQLVGQRQQLVALVDVAGRQPDRERQPVGVYGQVIAAPWAAQERARDLLAPFFASTNDASTITRDQSSLPVPTSRSCNTTSASANSPRCAHSSNLRLHVSPLGNPSSLYGTSNHGVSVNNTYKIPSKHCLGEYRFRPGDRKRRGGSTSNGSNCPHNSSETRHFNAFTRPTRRRETP